VKLKQYHAAFNTFEKALDQARLQGKERISSPFSQFPFIWVVRARPMAFGGRHKVSIFICLIRTSTRADFGKKYYMYVHGY